MKLNLQVEGQRGLNWARWQKFVPAVEALGFDGLFRSDHFVENTRPRFARNVGFAHMGGVQHQTHAPRLARIAGVVSASCPYRRMAKDVDDLSGGRLTLGVGAGWGGGVREHSMFGFDLLDTRERFLRWQEGLEVITRLLREPPPVNFEGKYFQLRDAVLRPRPQRLRGPDILIGGNGPHKVLEVAAKYGDEWNAIFRSPAQFRELNAELDTLARAQGRDPKSIQRSQMKGILFGRDDAAVERQLAVRQQTDPRTKQELLAWGMLIGTPAEIVDQLAELSEAGMQQAMIQWADLDDLDGLEYFSQSVLPRVQALA